jgi:hypothetical protein
MRLMLLLALSVVFTTSTATPTVELFRDDFSKFPPGRLSKPVGLLNGAIQEYHYLPRRGAPIFPWYNPTRLYKPVRNLLYNDSNYRATVWLPGWKQ